MPIDACLYAMALCLFFAVVFMAYSYFRYKQKAEYLMDIKARIQYGPEQMPKAANGIEEQYQEIIQQLYKKTAEAISKNDSSMSDMIDYYTLWGTSDQKRLSRQCVFCCRVKIAASPRTN